MYIKEIEIDNFKSFANKVTVPLLEGFTVIAGPNGSGKSNIIDSILFALGLAGARSLRSEEGVADLITNHNKRNEASVKVAFCDDNGEKEFTVRRYIKKGKNGVQSNYYYNDKPATRTQIHLELEKFNISPNSYNIVMQGDVNEIADCSPSKRREIVDEIAGTADFDRKINLALEQIGSVEQRVNETNILMSAVDEQIEKLKDQREVALKYKKYKDEKTALENQIQSAKYFDTKRSLELLHANILETVKEKKELQERLKETESKIQDTKVKYDEINSKVKAQGEEQQLEIKKTAEEKKGEIERKNSAAAQCQKTTIDNLKSIESYKNGIELQKGKIEEYKKSIDEKNQKLKDLKTQFEQKKAELDKIISEMTGMSKTADEHVQHRNQLRKELEDLNDKEIALTKEQLPLDNEYKNNDEKIKETTEQVEKLQNAAKVFESEKDKLDVQIETLTKEVDEYKVILNKTLDDLAKTTDNKEETYHNIRQAQNKVATLEATKNAYKGGGTQAGVESIMNAHIKGVHKPLAQLLDVESEYICAINVAIGSRANSIVVDNQDTAYKGIQLLRSIGRDRASFIPLDIIEKAPSKMPLPKGEGVIDYAINLIDFDDKYIDAVYFALRDTIVVENEAAAKKLARKYRVVTLEGDITEKSGLITGGAKKQRMNLFDKTQDKELEKYKKLLGDLEKKAVELGQKEKDLNALIANTRKKHSEAMTTLNSAKIELKNLVSTNENSAQLIDEGKTQLKELKARNAKLTKELDLFEKKRIKLMDEQSKVQEELESVEKLIDQGELKKLKEQTEGVEAQIKELDKAIMTTGLEIEKDESQIKFINAQIQTYENDIKKLTSDNEKLALEIEQYKNEAEVIKKELAELENKIEELGKTLKVLQVERDELQEILLNAKTDKNKFEDSLERLSEQEESYKARRKELDSIMENTLKEFEKAGINPKTLEQTDISLDEINTKIARLQKKMDDLEPVNMRALTDFDSAIEKQNEYKDKILTLENEKNEIKTRMTGYQGLKKETFLEAYQAINANFKEIFSKLAEGTGTLVLENEENPFQGGLTFKANIRDKKSQKLAGMSGGEKSLTALAFVFAIQKYLPSPFYAFDEVDMHLDGLNVEKLSSMITTQSKTAQFVVVSHRKPMLDNADRMIGVTQKDKGVTKISGIRLKDE